MASWDYKVEVIRLGSGNTVEKRAQLREEALRRIAQDHWELVAMETEGAFAVATLKRAATASA